MRRRTVPVDVVARHLDGVLDHGVKRRRDHVAVVPRRVPTQVVRQDLRGRRRSSVGESVAQVRGRSTAMSVQAGSVAHIVGAAACVDAP